MTACQYYCLANVPTATHERPENIEALNLVVVNCVSRKDFLPSPLRYSIYQKNFI